MTLAGPPGEVWGLPREPPRRAAKTLWYEGVRVSPTSRQEPVKTAPQPLLSIDTSFVAPSSHLTTGVHAMSDLVFVILTGAFFALASLIIKGVERL
jgi:hypothetical protein